MTPSFSVSNISIALLVATSWLLSGCAASGEEPTDVGTTSDALGGLAKGPLAGPVGQWTWIDIPGSECADGTTTGLGVNIGEDKGDVLVYFDGGGACWDEVSCLQLHTAVIIDGFQAPMFNAWRAAYAPGMENDGPWDRNQANNPFRKSTYIYVPYCTADVHSGDAVQQLSTRAMHYSGRKNAAVFVDAIKRSFPIVNHITVTGTSAGGFGATLNYWRFNRAYPLTRIDLIDDSGPTFPEATIALFPAWNAAWDFKGALPPFCTACQTNFDEVIPFYAKTNLFSRFAALSYNDDPTIEFFFSQAPATFAANLKSYTEGKLAPRFNARYFIPTRQNHGMLHNFSETSQGQSLGDWLTVLHDGTLAQWKSRTPL